VKGPAINPELRLKVETVFHQALEYSPETKREFLDWVCGGNSELRRQVELLLEGHARAESFRDEPDLAATATPDAAKTPSGFRQFRIVSLPGAGGMGEVYRAHDTKLGRDVASKVLPSEFAHDPERPARCGPHHRY
jgi:hypothetical protein